MSIILSAWLGEKCLAAKKFESPAMSLELSIPLSALPHKLASFADIELHATLEGADEPPFLELTPKWHEVKKDSVDVTVLVGHHSFYAKANEEIRASKRKRRPLLHPLI